MADRTESSIDIAAKPGEVLDVIADFESYPHWAAEVKQVTVLSEEGDGWADQVRFTLDAGVIKDTYVLDYEWDIRKNGTGVLSWSLVEGTVLKAMNGSYTLTATARELTKIYGEEIARRGYGEITTEIEPAGAYYYAEPHHQQYLHEVPHGYRCHANTGTPFPETA